MHCSSQVCYTSGSELPSSPVGCYCFRCEMNVNSLVVITYKELHWRTSLSKLICLVKSFTHSVLHILVCLPCCPLPHSDQKTQTSFGWLLEQIREIQHLPPRTAATVAWGTLRTLISLRGHQKRTKRALNMTFQAVSPWHWYLEETLRKVLGNGDLPAWHVSQQLCVAPFPKGLIFLHHSFRSLLVSGLMFIYRLI